MNKIAYSGGIANSVSLKVSIMPSTEKDIPKIVEIINGESKKTGSVLPVTTEEVRGWINSGLSFVAKTDEGRIIGHHAAYIWPESGWAELRAVVVLPEYRGNGINALLMESIINVILDKDPFTTVVSVKNRSSNGRQILRDLGFKEIDPSDAPHELFGIGPKEEVYNIYVYIPGEIPITKELIRS
ncbi:MAG: GNAT family N-acetyltransferase [Candidatus Marsarchaeota archaeon]|nr:GNAT family N-acetyltransferase [Candidatus Marsarchaeota archaeon]MCL5413233.1 GNAT family N-acetyltransferase [Candidatus Marsarchaeota archaeon]